jgi:hypothetical protein
MACNITSWSTIGCAMQQLLIVMLIFQQLLLGVHSIYPAPQANPGSISAPFTNQQDGKLLMIHFHYSFVIFVSMRESMR